MYLHILHILIVQMICIAWTKNVFADNQSENKAVLDVKITVIIDSLNNKSRELVFINPAQSLELAQKALAMSEEYKTGMAYAYRNIGNINLLNEVYHLGARYISKAENIFTEIKDSTGLADCYISYGHLYRRLNDNLNEIKYFKLAYDLYEKKSFPDRLGICALNLAESYYSDNQYTKSRELIDQALILNEEAKNLQVLSACYKLLGELETQNGNIVAATDYFYKVLDLNTFLGDYSQKIATIESLVRLSECFENKGNKSEQEEYLNRAIDFAVRNGLSNYIISNYNKLILFYLNNNKPDAAKKYLLVLNAKSDSINKYRMHDQSELVNNLIRTYNIDEEKNHLAVTNQLQEKSLKVRNILLIVIAFIAITILVILINLIQAKKKVKKQNIELLVRNNLIDKQKSELADLLANRDILFSIIAHDLRNPLNAILLILEFLETDIRNQSMDDIKSNVAMLSDSAKSAHELLENLLLWAKNQKENILPERLELFLYQEVDEAVKILQGIFKVKNISIKIDIDVEIKVVADKDMLQTILRNLIQNAVKYSYEDKEIVISADIKNKMVEISVKDDGIGMDKSTTRNVFIIDKSKIRNGTSGERGSGLGLVLCKQFVEKNDGTIWVESELNTGTTITFSLPVSNSNHL